MDKKENSKKEPYEDGEEVVLPYTLTLRKHVKVGDIAPIEELVFVREPSAASIMKFDVVEGIGKMESFLPVIAEMTKQSQEIIKRLSAKDYVTSWKIAYPFVVG